MLDTPVENMDRIDAGLKGVHGVFHLGNHAAGNNPVINEGAHVLNAESADDGIGIMGIHINPIGVREIDQFFRLQGFCHGISHMIGVDVVGAAGAVAPHRRDNRHIIAFDQGI